MQRRGRGGRLSAIDARVDEWHRAATPGGATVTFSGTGGMEGASVHMLVEGDAGRATAREAACWVF